MIAIENFPAVLTSLGFKEKGKRHSKTVGTATLEVRFDTQEIVYPESSGLVINERQTCNFSSNENFVVLECVHRLLTKGYKPEHIELEPKWQLGRGASGVRVVPDPTKVLPHFLCLMMNSKAFRDEARGQSVKSAGQININATKMRNIKVPVPPLAEQKHLVAKLQALEHKIAEAQAVIVGAPERKQAILQRYL